MNADTIVELQSWLETNKLQATIEKNIVECADKKFLFIEDKDGTLINKKFQLIVTQPEFNQTPHVDYYLFKFGSFFYYSEIDKLKLNKFKYLGEADDDLFDFSLPFLGIHGKYELCNGTRHYDDWCIKAKFLGYKSLAICEKNTLAGILHFQKSCEDQDIKPILGASFDINIGSEKVDTKFYVKSKEGWMSILRLLHEANSGDDMSITFDDLIENSKDLVIVIPASCKNYKKFIALPEDVYVQFDTTEFNSNETDTKRLNDLKTVYNSNLNPVLVSDAFYLDKEDHVIKDVINTVGKVNFQFSSSDQYFKSKQELVEKAEGLFADDDKAVEFVKKLIKNTREIDELCDYTLHEKKSHLPEYEMNEDEVDLADTNIDLFYHYIELGFAEKIAGKDNEKEYKERLDYEISVLIEGNVIDYFLILFDIVNWCKKNNILPGIGRGSAAGSLVSYLMGITGLDPLEHGLLFERFLNKARMLTGALPDIDQDVPSAHRQDIIEYVKTKYGKDQVACIGTSQNFKLKSLLKDMLKLKNVDFKEQNFITSMLTKEYDFADVGGLFELATKEPKILEVINDHWENIEMMDLCMFQPRSFGIHAAAIIVVPKHNEGRRTYVWDYTPVRMHNGQWVTEWEKDHIEQVGLLKEDILGLLQLDKLMRMVMLIKENKNIEIDVLKIPVDDPEVYELFAKGINQDIFQFGSPGQKVYTTELKPDNISDLIATVALYRPGAMENNSHNKYVKMKNGELEPVLPKNLEEFSEETFGLYIYQEQAMLSYQKITACELEEADKFRKALTKLKPGFRNPEIEIYEKIFKDKYFAMIHDKDHVQYVWDLIVGFSSYGFNKSHAAAYAITGYYAQWFKAHYPLEFYVTALEFADDKTISDVIHEIQHNSKTELKQPDINKSATHFTYDDELNEIYWSFNSIKYVTERSIDVIVEERNKSGAFFTFEEFLSRVKINKQAVENLILAGAFDTIEKHVDAYDRFSLLQRYYTAIKRLDSLEKIPEEFRMKNWWWQLQSKNNCGYGFIDYRGIFMRKANTTTYHHPDQFQKEDAEGYYITGGIVTNIIKRNSKKGPFVQLNIDHNNIEIIFTVWNDAYSKIRKDLAENRLIVFKADLSWDGYKKKNTFKSGKKTFIHFV